MNALDEDRVVAKRHYPGRRMPEIVDRDAEPAAIRRLIECNVSVVAYAAEAAIDAADVLNRLADLIDAERMWEETLIDRDAQVLVEFAEQLPFEVASKAERIRRGNRPPLPVEELVHREHEGV